jgi:serralysin
MGRGMAIVIGGDKFAIDMSSGNFLPLQQGVTSFAVTNLIYVDDGSSGRDAFFGNFAYDALGMVSGGVLNHIQENLAGFLHFDISGFSISATAFFRAPGADAAFSLALAGADTISGTFRDDVIKGYDGNDTINGGGGFDSIDAGAGDDLVIGGVLLGKGEGVLRGGDGNDSILGSYNFDDINGNAGNDTAHGGDATDWVVGGQGDDLLFGDDGDDIVYGNLGNDTVDGGAGADIVRGGQGNDSVAGGAGNDWLSGDLGGDTLRGGSGADIFHAFADTKAGADLVVDFSAAEGDRVLLDPGTAYSVRQVGADTVISMVEDDEPAGTITLVGVTLSSLPPGWIFGA